MTITTKHLVFRINQYNATKFNQRTAKSQLVAELGPVQPQLVVIVVVVIVIPSKSKVNS